MMKQMQEKIFYIDDYRAMVSLGALSEKQNCPFRLDNAYLEPDPIPTPDERIKSLIDLKKLGCSTVLALRPFLPMVAIDEYLTILDKCKGSADIVLGEPYHFKDVDSKSFQRVFCNQPQDLNAKFSKLKVDTGNGIWQSWASSECENAIRQKCQQIGSIFSMSSEDAITQFRIGKSVNSSVCQPRNEQRDIAT